MPEVKLNPLVSVIIPCYNAEAYIAETILSVLNQTIQDLEIIIVNDGSVDGSVEVINKYLSDEKITLVNKENEGVSSARNIGIKQAKGKYIALLDADDVWLENNLKHKVTILENDENILYVYSAVIEFYADESEKFIQGYQTENVTEKYLQQRAFPIFGVCSNIVYRNFSKKLDSCFFDENLSTAADQDFMIMLSLLGKGKYIDEYLWKYRVLSSSMSRNILSIEKDHLYMNKKYEKLNIYKDKMFKFECFSNTHLILAGCFWKDENNKIKSLHHIFYAIMYKPSLISLLFKKL